MAKQVINVGSSAGDGSGDALRDAMIKINSNFTELYNGIVVQTIVGENGTTLVDISTNSVNANALTGTVPTGVATWDNLGGKPTSVAGFGIADAYTIAQTDAQIASEIDDLKIALGSGSAGVIDASALTGSLPAIDGSALTNITAGSATSLDGDMTGSVFADDSTLLVDGVNASIPAEIVTIKPFTIITEENYVASNGERIFVPKSYPGSADILGPASPSAGDWFIVVNGKTGGSFQVDPDGTGAYLALGARTTYTFVYDGTEWSYGA